MPPLLHPYLVNGRFGDAALYVRTQFARSALLFDLGDLGPLSPRQLLDVDHAFVSHAHVDHFVGFDRLLRILVGRDKQIDIWGPKGFADRIGHKLQAYQWNLADQFRHDLRFTVSELGPAGPLRRVCFSLKRAFSPIELEPPEVVDGVILRGVGLQVRAAVLDHGIPCLGFALEETAQANVWKTRLDAEGLPVGPWLRDLKQAILEGRPDDHPVKRVGMDGRGTTQPLGRLRHLVSVTPGRRFAYVTDVADTPDNRRAILSLAKDADILFIEAPFAREDAAAAAERAHLTTQAAGEIARAAGAGRVEPFHFSARYKGEEGRMMAEVMTAFQGQPA